MTAIPSHSSSAESQARLKQDEVVAARPPWRRLLESFIRRYWPILLGVTTITGILLYWLHASRFEETDNAQVDGDITSISARVSGNVVAQYVSENQPVRFGDLLLELDPRDFDTALARAQADVELARAKLAAEEPTVQISETSTGTAKASALADIRFSVAGLTAARQEVGHSAAELAKYEAQEREAVLERARGARLVRSGVISRAQMEALENAAAASSAALDAQRQSLNASKQHVVQQEAQMKAVRARYDEVSKNGPLQVQMHTASVLAERATLDAALASLAQAQLNQSYIRVTAPVDGIVARKTVSVGDRLSPGQQVIAIAQTGNLWVTANFRETQLAHLRPGQTVDMHVDALGYWLRGKVESIGGSTGARLSLLPPENAVGNYVKVTQLIPVRIRFDPNQAGMERLRPGMSVEPRVHL